MLEILGIIVIGAMARGKGYSFALGLLGVGAAWLGAFVAFFIGAGLFQMLDRGDVGGFWLVLLAGYLGGYASVFFYVAHLPYKGMEAPGTAPCPACGSLQTERVGDFLNCFACDELTEL